MQDTKATVVWIILMGLSLLMFGLTQSGYETSFFVLLLLASAWFKGQMIIDYFMGLRRVEKIWRLIISIWLIIVLSTILIVYLLSK